MCVRPLIAEVVVPVIDPRRVRPSGYVLATDLSAGILKNAKANADLAGIAHIDCEIASNCDPSQG